nr:PHP domain-containing protein [Actinomycetota bacterium]
MFTHLHMASGYSFKYGTHLPDAIVERAAEFEMKSLALTDRDGLAGAIRFVESCQKYNVSPILGVDLKYKINGTKSRITLIAKSGGGWRSLVRLVTAINTFDPEKPILTIDLLQKFSTYTKDLLALHGSESAISQALVKRDYKKAMAIFNSGDKLFADQAIECVSHLAAGDGPYSTTHAGRMLGFARDNDLPAVISNAARMLDRSDGPVADILDC